MEPMRRLGLELPTDFLLGDELHAVEPALSHRVQAGFYVEQQWHVRASTFTEGLARRVRELGVELVEAWTRPLARRLGVGFPMEPGKG